LSADPSLRRPEALILVPTTACRASEPMACRGPAQGS
jgi:hypothetical protein